MDISSQAITAGTEHEAGRQLLKKMYLARTGRTMPPVAVTPRGKPYFPDSAIHFSISHTKQRVFCVLSDRPVGIDAEQLDRKIDLRLAEKILSASEKEQYDRAADPHRALLTFWVLKEAAAKCTGQGLRIYPNDTDFSLHDTRVQIRDGCLVAVIEEDEYAV